MFIHPNCHTLSFPPNLEILLFCVMLLLSLSPLRPVCVAQIVLRLGPALLCVQPTMATPLQATVTTGSTSPNS